MEENLVIIKKVIEEMRDAEEFVRDWRISWSEQLCKCSCEDLYYISEKQFLELKKKYGCYVILPGIDEPREKEGLPLRVETLSDNSGNEYDCEFREINWNNMHSANAERTFTFSNNGDITFSKGVRSKEADSSRRNKKMHKKFNRTISYNAKYNVASSDFEMEIVTKESTLKSRSIGPYVSYDTTIDTYYITLTGTILTKRFDDIKIMEDLSTGIKVINIVKKHDKKDKQTNASVEYEARINADNSLEAAKVAISTYKNNGKVNGNFRFDVSRTNGISANFYSRKGKKIDLIENPHLLQNTKNLLTTNESSNKIVNGFTSSTEIAITKNKEEETGIVESKPERIISFDASDFNMAAVIEADAKIMNLIKSIKGEIPLSGLRDRIDYCLELIERPTVEVIEDKPKVLALEAK